MSLTCDCNAFTGPFLKVRGLIIKFVFFFYAFFKYSVLLNGGKASRLCLNRRSRHSYPLKRKELNDDDESSTIQSLCFMQISFGWVLGWGVHTAKSSLLAAFYIILKGKTAENRRNTVDNRLINVFFSFLQSFYSSFLTLYRQWVSQACPEAERRRLYISLSEAVYFLLFVWL